MDGQRGALVAWDPATQKERWRAPGGGSTGGGTVSTAGNLVFQVVPDGRLMAYSADKGEKLLEIQTNLSGGMGPPITYQLVVRFLNNIAITRFMAQQRIPPPESPTYTSI